MNAIIVYYSQTGFTRQYAEWLADALKCSCIPYECRKQIGPVQYDMVVFGSWCHAGRIKKLKWFLEAFNVRADCRKAVFAVGAMPSDSPEVERLFEQNMSAEDLKKIPAFYAPGGLRYEKMSLSSRLMMKAFSQMVANKKDKTADEEEMARIISHSFDISDRSYLEPMIQCLQSQ